MKGSWHRESSGNISVLQKVPCSEWAQQRSSSEWSWSPLSAPGCEFGVRPLSLSAFMSCWPSATRQPAASMQTELTMGRHRVAQQSGPSCPYGLKQNVDIHNVEASSHFHCFEAKHFICTHWKTYITIKSNGVSLSYLSRLIRAKPELFLITLQGFL